MSFIGDLFGGGGDDAADAAIKASEITAGGQEKALDYLKSTEAVPQQFREGSLKNLAGIYGLPGGTGSQEETIQQVINSPLYQAIVGNRSVGEEAINRNAGATGGLRSGNANYNLADYNVRLENEALLQGWNQQISGLTGLAGLPSNANNISSLISGIDATRGQGIIAAAQANQAGSANNMNNIMGIANLGIQAYGSGMFSDRRLKKNIQRIGEVNGFPFYSFEWNEQANAIGLYGKTVGSMADEVFARVPDAVSFKDGFLFVHYDRIGVV
jgi:hypothetical protein